MEVLTVYGSSNGVQTEYMEVRQFFLRQNIFRAFKNNDQIPDTFRILEKYTEKYT